MVQVLAIGSGAVMTTETGTQHLTVVGGEGRRPLHGCVACLTLLRRLHVGGVLPGCICIVMTGTAYAEHMIMVYSRWLRPLRGGMTGAAQIGRLQMRRFFSFGLRAVVAATTIFADTGVINVSGYPCVSAMTAITFEDCLNMFGLFS